MNHRLSNANTAHWYSPGRKLGRTANAGYRMNASNRGSEVSNGGSYDRWRHGSKQLGIQRRHYERSSYDYQGSRKRDTGEKYRFPDNRCNYDRYDDRNGRIGDYRPHESYSHRPSHVSSYNSHDKYMGCEQYSRSYGRSDNYEKSRDAKTTANVRMSTSQHNGRHRSGTEDRNERREHKSTQGEKGLTDSNGRKASATVDCVVRGKSENNSSKVNGDDPVRIGAHKMDDQVKTNNMTSDRPYRDVKNSNVYDRKHSGRHRRYNLNIPIYRRYHYEWKKEIVHRCKEDDQLAWKRLNCIGKEDCFYQSYGSLFNWGIPTKCLSVHPTSLIWLRLE